MPYKPHPSGNKCHTIADGDNGEPIIFWIDLVEGKYWQKQLGKREFWEKGEILGIILSMTKPLWNLGKKLDMYCGLCVAKGVIKLHERGVYGDALAKNYWYRIKFAPGDKITVHLTDKKIGDIKTREVIVDVNPFLVHFMKGVRYVTKAMSIHGCLNSVDRERTSHSVTGVYGVDIRDPLLYTELF